MEQKKQLKQLKTVYSEIVKKLVDPSFKFSEGGATTRVLNKFLSNVAETFGAVTEQRLVDLCVFLAYTYRSKRFSISAIFGNASLNRFNQRKRGQCFYENEWLNKKGLTRANLLKLIDYKERHPLADYIYLPVEEPRKERLHNQRSGFIACQVSTTGWSPLSSACNECSFVDECKRETERKYPELYRIRLENGNTQRN